MPHPRLTRGDALRTRAEQIVSESATEHLDNEPTVRQIPVKPEKKGAPAKQTTFSLNH